MRRVILLWHGDEPIGICVFAFGPLSSSLRNRLFGIRGRPNRELARRINDNFTSVSRLVLDPRYRGAGIAANFLKRCCELATWPWIELVSEMADLVPFCESAGFNRIAKSPDKFLKKPSRRSTAWVKSGWTEKGFKTYTQKSRFSRPVYYLYDNRH